MGLCMLPSPLLAPDGDTLQHISLDGKVTTLAVGGPVAGATAAIFGRTEKDKNVIYLSTMGGFDADYNRAASAKVVAVTLK